MNADVTLMRTPCSVSVASLLHSESSFCRLISCRAPNAWGRPPQASERAPRIKHLSTVLHGRGGNAEIERKLTRSRHMAVLTFREYGLFL